MVQKIHRYEGEEGVVIFDAARCLHAAECVHGLPEVFDTARRPWVAPDGAGPEAVAAVVARCPTGALAFLRRQGDAGEPVPEVAEVRVSADGPLYVHGSVELAGTDESRRETRAALCRCGASANKPYCDGSHDGIAFRDPGTFAEVSLAPAVEGAPTDSLRITLRPDGPLLLAGPVALLGADGVRCAGGKASLCRCGASQRKPFCDGSHNRIGFKA